jgi:hypothetical protein
MLHDDADDYNTIMLRCSTNKQQSRDAILLLLGASLRVAIL